MDASLGVSSLEKIKMKMRDKISRKMTHLSLRDDEVIIINGIPLNARTLKTLSQVLYMDNAHEICRDIMYGTFQCNLAIMRDDEGATDFKSNFFEITMQVYDLLHAHAEISDYGSPFRHFAG
jgi:hypothetical protein